MREFMLPFRADPPPEERDWAVSAHAPTRGRLARALGRFHVTGAFWYKAHLFAVRRLPAWTLAPLIRIFTLFFFLTAHRIRHALGANLEPVLGTCGFVERQRRAHRTLFEFAWCLTERYEHFGGRPAPRIEIDNDATWDVLRRTDSGLIVLTAHIGNWEISSSLLPLGGGRRVHVVREREIALEAQAVIRDLVERRADDRFVTHFAGDPALSLLLAERLARGEIVALQGDRPRADGRTLPAAMFGRLAELPLGPLALARIARVPIVPAFCYRTGRWSYRVHIAHPIRVACTRDRQRDLADAVTEVARTIEAAIAARPHQWFCFAEMWPGGGSASAT